MNNDQDQGDKLRLSQHRFPFFVASQSAPKFLQRDKDRAALVNKWKGIDGSQFKLK